MASAIERGAFNYSNPQPYVVANYGASERKAPLRVNSALETPNGEDIKSAAARECFICGRNILGASYTCLGHFVHAHCFQCSTCGTDLSGLEIGLAGAGKKPYVEPLLVNERFYCRLHGEQRKQLLPTKNELGADKPCPNDGKVDFNTTTTKLPATHQRPPYPPKGAYHPPPTPTEAHKKDPNNNNCVGRTTNLRGVKSTTNYRPSTAVHHKTDAVPATVKNGNLPSELNRTLAALDLSGQRIPSISDRWPPKENYREKTQTAWRYWKYKPDSASTCIEMSVANRYRIDENGLVTMNTRRGDGTQETVRHTWRKQVVPTPQRLLTPMSVGGSERDVLQRKLDREKETDKDKDKAEGKKLAASIPHIRPLNPSIVNSIANRELDSKFLPPPIGKISTTDAGIPVCEFCQEAVSGAYVLANGRSWCPEHFTCSNSACARRLLGCGFIQEENGGMYCEKCYEALIAPSCAKCGLAIVSDCLSALQKQWHTQCFTCTHCRRPFGNLSFYLEDGKPYCENDWNQLFTNKCVSCNGPIKAGQRWMEALGSPYHTHCFNCTTCQSNLEGQSFYARDGRAYCRLHI